MANITSLKSWQALTQLSKQPLDLQECFQKNGHRFKDFSLEACQLHLDYSKQWVTKDILKALCKLAEETQLKEKVQDLFSGATLNVSEQRPALHTALRNVSNTPVKLNGHDIMPEISAALNKMVDFYEAVTTEQHKGYDGQAITDVINVGIGGSHLGPALACQALQDYKNSQLNIHFVSNLDQAHLEQLLKALNPATTLVILSSKSFATQETLYHGEKIRHWFQNDKAIKQNFVAITENKEKALEWGILESAIFPIWDWVGGRFSLWSSIGLPILMQLGTQHFFQLLAGAHAMDQHFQETPCGENMPTIKALISLWYSQFHGCQSQAILPYETSLQAFPQYCQQLEMESNGKSVDMKGNPVNYPTASIIWGGVETNGQHAFHQLLHQGRHLIPVDFILSRTCNHYPQEHAIQYANGLAQSRVLMTGRNEETIKKELLENGIPEAQAGQLAKHKAMPGNRPSSTLVLHQLDPYSLGALVALYEHKVFAQAAILGINAFDQWGVELGKHVASEILEDLTKTTLKHHYDASTQGLLRLYQRKD